MCKKCEELEKAFKDEDGIAMRETRWKEWQSQKSECEKPKKKK